MDSIKANELFSGWSYKVGFLWVGLLYSTTQSKFNGEAKSRYANLKLNPEHLVQSQMRYPLSLRFVLNAWVMVKAVTLIKVNEFSLLHTCVMVNDTACRLPMSTTISLPILNSYSSEVIWCSFSIELSSPNSMGPSE